MTIEDRTRRVREVAKKLPPLLDRSRRSSRDTARLKVRRPTPPTTPRQTDPR